MYTDRLNEIMILSGAKNRQIAKYAGYDPSTLTHLRKVGVCKTPEAA